MQGRLLRVAKFSTLFRFSARRTFNCELANVDPLFTPDRAIKVISDLANPVPHLHIDSGNIPLVLPRHVANDQYREPAT